MNDANDIRQSVSEHYARAVSRPPAGVCCGGAPADTQLAAIADYTPQELADLPADAVAHAFGCGDPVAFSALRPGETVLDLGCGAGIDLLLAAKKVGPAGRVIGVDMTDAMIERARANIAAAGLQNVEVRKGYIEDLPVETALVDWVISNCVINLSPDKPRVFREIARVLKPGGRMLVSDIVAQDLPPWVRADRGLYGSCVAGAIGEGEYLDGLRAAGLTDVAVRDRLVYDAAQLEALVQVEAVAVSAGASCGCGCGLPEGWSVRDVVQALAGRIASIKAYARKPAG